MGNHKSVALVASSDTTQDRAFADALLTALRSLRKDPPAMRWRWSRVKDGTYRPWGALVEMLREAREQGAREEELLAVVHQLEAGT